MPKLTADPFTHFASDYIKQGKCGRRMPTLEELTEAWEDLGAGERSDYIVAAAEWAGDAAPAGPAAVAKDADAPVAVRRDVSDRPAAPDRPKRERPTDR